MEGGRRPLGRFLGVEPGGAPGANRRYERMLPIGAVDGADTPEEPGYNAIRYPRFRKGKGSAGRSGQVAGGSVKGFGGNGGPRRRDWDAGDSL